MKKFLKCENIKKVIYEFRDEIDGVFEKMRFDIIFLK